MAKSLGYRDFCVLIICLLLLYHLTPTRIHKVDHDKLREDGEHATKVCLLLPLSVPMQLLTNVCGDIILLLNLLLEFAENAMYVSILLLISEIAEIQLTGDAKSSLLLRSQLFNIHSGCSRGLLLRCLTFHIDA